MSLWAYTKGRNVNECMRFVMLVVFYETANIECVYLSNTTIFIGASM